MKREFRFSFLFKLINITVFLISQYSIKMPGYTCYFNAISERNGLPSVKLGEGTHFPTIHDFIRTVISEGGYSGMPIYGIVHCKYKPGSKKRQENPLGIAYYETRRPLPTPTSVNSRTEWHDTYIINQGERNSEKLERKVCRSPPDEEVNERLVEEDVTDSEEEDYYYSLPLSKRIRFGGMSIE